MPETMTAVCRDCPMPVTADETCPECGRPLCEGCEERCTGTFGGRACRDCHNARCTSRDCREG